MKKYERNDTMGYRYHFAIVDKEKAKMLSIKSPESFLPDVSSEDYDEELCEKTAFYEMVENELDAVEDFDLGQISIPEEAKIHTSRFFTNDKTAELFEHYEACLIFNAQPIEAVIEYMRQQILKDYQECLENENLRLAKIHRKVQEWTAEFCKPYNTSPDSKYIVHSNSFEYQIFELVRFLKTIDWETQSVIYFGW